MISFSKHDKLKIIKNTFDFKIGDIVTVLDFYLDDEGEDYYYYCKTTDFDSITGSIKINDAVLITEFNQLNLEYLAPYLPYDVKCYRKSSEIDYYERVLDHYLMMVLINESTFWKLGLRPLTKDVLNPFKLSSSEKEKILKDGIQYDTPYGIVKELLKNHIDVFKLIDKKLAININELN